MDSFIFALHGVFEFFRGSNLARVLFFPTLGIGVLLISGFLLDYSRTVDLRYRHAKQIVVLNVALLLIMLTGIVRRLFHYDGPAIDYTYTILFGIVNIYVAYQWYMMRKSRSNPPPPSSGE